MRVLFISNDLIAGNLAYLLTKEGHDVKLYIDEKGRRGNFRNLVKQTKNWKKDLSWVGKDGLIIFDDVGYGQEQEQLRSSGYNVFGGSTSGDRLEFDRDFAQGIFAEYGLKIMPIKTYNTVQAALVYVENNPKAWVIKQNEHASKSINYIGQFNDGRDVITVLKNYSQNSKLRDLKISIQERIYGVEIGIGRYFNGYEWVGPVEYNVEHKKFFPGDVGPTTSEMGTLAWYDNNENNKLYRETLGKLKPYLQKINFRGDFEINCIVNETGAYPLEATPRLGSPIIHLHSELHKSPWGEFLYAVACGKSYDLQFSKEIGIVVLIAVPPFPYSKKITETNPKHVEIFFDDLTEKDFDHIHFEDISFKKNRKKYYISDSRGYVLYITGTGKSIADSRKNTYSLVKKVFIPKMFYRNDIGVSFAEDSIGQLEKWGYFYINESGLINGM